MFFQKKNSEFLENPRSAGLPGSKKSPDLSSQEGTMEAHHKSLFCFLFEGD